MDEWHNFVRAFAALTAFWMGVDFFMEVSREKGTAKIIDFKAFKAKAGRKTKT